MKIVETSRKYIVTDGDEKLIINYDLTKDKFDILRTKVRQHSNIVERAKEVIRQSLINESVLTSMGVNTIPMDKALKEEIEEIEAIRFANSFIIKLKKLFEK